LLRCLLALSIVFAAPSARAAEQLIDGIAAQVGSDVVLISEVTRVTGPMEDQLREAGGTDRDLDMLRVDMLERLIERRLVEQVVRRMELEANDAEIDQAIGAIAQENGLTLDQLRESLESREITWESYREKIRSEIQRSKILNGMVRSKVKVEDSEVRALYEQRYSSQRQGGEVVHLRHLVVTGGEDAPRTHEQACDAVRRALARIQAGEPFEALAREISETNPRGGGDVGWVHVADIAPWMGDAVRDLDGGTVSAVIEMPFGCNLFQVVERRGFEPVTYEKAQEQLYVELYNKSLEREYEKWIEELRRRTYIERKGIFAAAARLGGEEAYDPTKIGEGLSPLEPLEP